MRLFIAIPLPKEVKQQLLHLQQPIEGIRWQHPEQMHLTLKFLGEVDQQETGELLSALVNIDHPRFMISIEGMGGFPKNKQPTVIWVGIEGNELLTGLHQKIEEACWEIGIAPERRAYIPHITLGRVKNGSRQVINAFVNLHQKFSVEAVPVNEFVLYQSELHPDGARHSRMQTFALSANG